jgi:exosortase/archaeosortase family protein
MFNIVRIVIIVLLAPSMMEHYNLMHEIIGGATYWACLILIWLALNGPTEQEKALAK